MICCWAPGRRYAGFLATARAALEVGVPEFVERDWRLPRDLARLPALAPILARLSLADLLAPQDRQCALSP